MNPLTEARIRGSFINATKGEAKRASLPDVSGIAWDEIDYLGWQDAKKPIQHHVVIEVDGEPVGIFLRGTEQRTARKMMCAWCEDVVDGVRATSFVAPLAGASGRRGNTIGTSVCGDFACSRNVRRPPAPYELRTEDPQLLAWHREQRIAGLRERAASFVRAVMKG